MKISINPSARDSLIACVFAGAFCALCSEVSSTGLSIWSGIMAIVSFIIAGIEAVQYFEFKYGED